MCTCLPDPGKGAVSVREKWFALPLFPVGKVIAFLFIALRLPEINRSAEGVSSPPYPALHNCGRQVEAKLYVVTSLS